MFGSPTVSISGNASRMASQSKKVSHRVRNGSIVFSYRPLSLDRPYVRKRPTATAPPPCRCLA